MLGHRRLALRDDRGAQAVEFAIIVPVLLALVYGIIVFGFGFNAQISATQLAREGARAAAICGMQGGCTATATGRVNSAKPPGFTIVSVLVSECPSASGDASVTVTTHPPLSYPPFIDSSAVISGKATTPCGG